jgi:Flp pilus assembly protein TadD
MSHITALVSKAVATLLFVQLDVSTISAPPTALAPAAPLRQQTLNEAFNNGNSKLMIGEFQEALDSFNRAAELAPGNEDVYLSRGIALEKLLKWDDAISDYRKSNELHKKNHLFAKVSTGVKFP